MALTDRIRSLIARVTQSYQPNRATRIVYTQKTLAGLRVSPDTALQSAAVWACVQILSKSVAQLPWRAMRRLSAHSSEIADTSLLDYLLNERPNPEMSAFTFRETLMGHALLWGNGYAEIERDRAGRPANLWPIEPDRVFPRRGPSPEKPNRDVDELWYQITNQTKGVAELDAADIFHIHGPSFDGVTGYQVVGYAAQSIGLVMAIERFGASFFGNNATPGGTIEAGDSRLSADAKEVLLAEFNEKHQGSDQAFKWTYLDKGMKANPFPIENDKGQFIQAGAASVDQICRWFGVPPHKVAQLERSTNNNIEHQGIEFVTDGILPWTTRFEQEANYKLIGRRNPTNLYTRIDVRSLQRGDLAARTTFYTAMFLAGAMSPNMILEAEGMNPVGTDGDKRFVPLNVQRLDQVGEIVPVADAASGGSATQGDDGATQQDDGQVGGSDVGTGGGPAQGG
jgi:HK97 family phage portal protein